jgi:hypothetical protein
VTVVWGEPITFDRTDDPSAEQVAEARDIIWESICKLYAEALAIDQLRREGTWKG